MATYCNTGDVKLRLDNDSYLRLTKDGGSLSGDALTAAIIGKVDGYMRDVFRQSYEDVSLLEGNFVINELCVELVVCALYKRREKHGVLLTAETVESCEQAEQLLKDIGAGKVPIYNEDGQIDIRYPEIGLSVDSETIKDMEYPPNWYNDVNIWD